VSDFLNNLARRSLGSAEVVQPRLPALFEQVQPVAGSLFAPRPLMSEKAQEQEILAERESENTSLHRGNIRLSAADFLLARRRPDESSTREYFQPTPPKATVAPAMTWPRPIVPVPSSALAAQTPGARSSSPLSKLAPDESGQLATRLNRAGKDATTPPAESDLSSRTMLERREQVPELKPRLPVAPAQVNPPAEHGSPQYSAVADLPATLRRFIESRIKTQPQMATPAASSRPGGSSEPTIQVTIGRIEVRATHQQAPAARGRATSQVMGLEDYLRRRSQRGGQ
jgi:hypothetical protein